MSNVCVMQINAYAAENQDQFSKKRLVAGGAK
jgi:hypothetical protein